MSRTAEAIFLDSIISNSRMTRSRARPHVKNIKKGREIVTPDEVISKLASIGVHLSRGTILNYEKWNLIPKADRRAEGGRKGNITDYPDDTPAEAYAAWALMHGAAPDGAGYKLSPAKVAEVRRLAMEIEARGFFNWTQDQLLANKDRLYKDYIPVPPETFSAQKWTLLKAKIEAGGGPDSHVIVTYNRVRGPDGREKIEKKVELHPTLDLIGAG